MDYKILDKHLKKKNKTIVMTEKQLEREKRKAKEEIQSNLRKCNLKNEELKKKISTCELSLRLLKKKKLSQRYSSKNRSKSRSKSRSRSY